MVTESRLLEGLAIQPSVELRERILASVDPATPLAGMAPRLAEFFDLPAGRASQILLEARAVESSAWESAPIPGVRLHHLRGGPRFAGADCGLVHLAPGTAFPMHLHRGDEWNLVLSGCIEEDTGERWEAGDMAIRRDGSRHAFRAVGDAPVLFAVILHGGIEVEPR